MIVGESLCYYLHSANVLSPRKKLSKPIQTKGLNLVHHRHKASADVLLFQTELEEELPSALLSPNKQEKRK